MFLHVGVALVVDIRVVEFEFLTLVLLWGLLLFLFLWDFGEGFLLMIDIIQLVLLLPPLFLLSKLLKLLSNLLLPVHLFQFPSSSLFFQFLPVLFQQLLQNSVMEVGAFVHGDHIIKTRCLIFLIEIVSALLERFYLVLELFYFGESAFCLCPFQLGL